MQYPFTSQLRWLVPLLNFVIRLFSPAPDTPMQQDVKVNNRRHPCCSRFCPQLPPLSAGTPALPSDVIRTAVFLYPRTILYAKDKV